MSGKRVFIYSTLTAAVTYNSYVTSGNNLPVSLEQVTIQGGHGTADKRGDTIMGAVTEVTEDQLTVLKGDPVFQLHVKNGFIKIVEGQDDAADPEKVAADMAGKDKSAPATDADFQDLDDVKAGGQGNSKKK